jgi:group I intron endonuclease
MDNSGIYQIRNIVNGKLYIGSTQNIETRWRQHQRALKVEKHCNKYLQHAWIAYGKSNFKFEILEEVNDKSKLISKEQYYLDLYKSYLPENGYNTRSIADRNAGVISWNKDSWKSKVSEEELVKYYKENHTKKECALRFGISIDTVTKVLKENNILRSKKEARYLRDNIHPEYAKEVGLRNKGKLSGSNHPNFGKPGFWKGKKMPEETFSKAKQTRFDRYGSYFSKESIESIRGTLLSKNYLRAAFNVNQIW